MIRIFLVDHAAKERQSVGGCLRAQLASDFSLTCADSYGSILEGFRSDDFDVCVIDSAAGNGPRLFAQARSLGYAAPIVLVTSNDAGEVVGALRSGAADCLIRTELTANQIERSLWSVVAKARGNSLQLERERRYLGLVDHANEIIYTHDCEGNFTSMNRVGEQLLGFSPGEMLSLNISQLVVAEFRGRFGKLIERTLDAHTQTLEEIELMTKDGHHLRFQMATHPIYHQGKPTEVQGIAKLLPSRLAWEPRGSRSPDIYRAPRRPKAPGTALGKTPKCGITSFLGAENNSLQKSL